MHQRHTCIHDQLVVSIPGPCRQGEEKTNLLVESDHFLVLLPDLLDFLLHPVERLGVGLRTLLGGRLFELERLLDIVRERDEGGNELRGKVDGRSGQGGEGGLLEDSEHFVKLCMTRSIKQRDK
jgi:hypothetical protein